MVKTNIREPGDDRPLPPGIGVMRPRSGRQASLRVFGDRNNLVRQSPAPPRRPPVITPMPTPPRRHITPMPPCPTAESLAAVSMPECIEDSRHNCRQYIFPASPANAPFRSHPASSGISRNCIATISCVISQGKPNGKKVIGQREDQALQASLDPEMETYVRNVWDWFVVSNISRPLHKALEQKIKALEHGIKFLEQRINALERRIVTEDEEEHGKLREGAHMIFRKVASMKELFHGDPLMCFEFELYIRVKDKADTPAIMTWGGADGMETDAVGDFHAAESSASS